MALLETKEIYKQPYHHKCWLILLHDINRLEECQTTVLVVKRAHKIFPDTLAFSCKPNYHKVIPL